MNIWKCIKTYPYFQKRQFSHSPKSRVKVITNDDFDLRGLKLVTHKSVSSA